MRLANKTALITGGTSGIGRATVDLFAAEGARVVFTGRRAQLGAQVARETGAQFVLADHSSLPECERSVAAALAILGSIDILFNNAGIVMGGTAETTSESDWEAVMQLNVTVNRFEADVVSRARIF